MMDFKSTKPKTQTKKKGRKPQISRTPLLNEMYYRWTVEGGDLASNTAGIIAFSSSPSLQNSSENSVIQNLFVEVRLISFRVVYTPIQSANGSVIQSTFIVGTNMIFNQTTNTAPSSFTSVQNLVKSRTIASVGVRPVSVSMVVPKGLEFLSTATGSDVPTIPNPYAGSPGMLVGYGTGFTASTTYFKEQQITVMHLRGRQ